MGFFSKATFHEDVFLQNSTFNGAIDFIEATFKKMAYFNRAIFDGDATFIKTTFCQNADYSGTQCNTKLLFGLIKIDENTILKFANCRISSEAITFQNCDPTCLDLTQQRDLTNIHFIDSPWEKNDRIKACTEDDRLQLTRDFYQRMKAKYKAENNEYEASRWHVAEKEAQLKLLGQSENVKFNWFMLWLYKQSSFFGEWPRRAFKVFLLLLFLPLLILTGIEVYQHFAWMQFDPAKVDHVIGEWLRYIPLTKAASDEPSSALRAFMFFWQLLITVQAALFAFALRNNFRR
ncbi:hypothetical protein PSDVSF_31900 [Pseudodesulfovibrio sediminis]|uniref:Pentapeptide repeat-containing protein n=2 Tax=Pseudodesulfovibrio sediminis TaxID=2810563 RepID=A0ABM7P9Z6_9BACT|nr:hypothetical protein PSDVSF_31900 [Pseudodesulfovibrio sediminis]